RAVDNARSRPAPRLVYLLAPSGYGAIAVEAPRFAKILDHRGAGRRLPPGRRSGTRSRTPGRSRAVDRAAADRAGAGQAASGTQGRRSRAGRPDRPAVMPIPASRGVRPRSTPVPAERPMCEMHPAGAISDVTRAESANLVPPPAASSPGGFVGVCG